MKFIHITDPHLVAPGKMLWGADPADRFGRCLDDIARWHGDAEFCVISGDLADTDYPEAYAWLARRLESFPLRTFLMIGNHDDRQQMIAHLPGLPQDSNGYIQYRHDTPEHAFLFLDTYKGGTSAGQFCQDRQNWLREQLADTAGRHVRIFMHHPPFDIALPYMDRIKLDEATDFAAIIADAKNLRHIFFGHVHRPVFLTWNGLTASALPGTNHQVPLVRDSVESRYSIEPPMYAVVTLAGADTLVHCDACLDRHNADMS